MQTELSALEVERLYAHLGRAYADQNAWQQAQEAYEELLTYAQRQHQFTLASLTLNRLAILAVQQASDKPKARALLEEALQMAEASQDQRALAETEWNLAQITTAAWEGEKEQTIGHLREAAQLAAEIGLPGEQWQIQAALGSVYETAGEQAQARTAFREAARIIQELAQGIKDETLQSRFLAGPQIHPVLQHAQRLATSIPDDHTEPSGL